MFGLNVAKKILLSLIFSLFLTNAWADDNPRLIGYPEGKIMGFLGLDTRTPAPNIQDARATDLLNVKLSSAFNLKKRYGYSVINGTLDDAGLTPTPITGLFDAEYSNGNSWTLAFLGTRLKYDNAGTWTTVTGNPAISASQDAQWVCQMALDNAICTNGVNPPLAIDSTPSSSALAFTGLSNAVTKAEAVIWFRNYLIFGNTTEGGTARPTRFRWSNVGTINTYSNNDFVDISSFSGDEIVGYVEMYGDLFILMRKSIWKASLVGGNDVFVFSKVIDGLGAIAKNSIEIVNLPGNRLGVIYLNENKKMYLFNGAVVEDIGAIIQPTLDDLNASRLEYAVAVFDDKDYMLSVSSEGVSTNDIVLDFQTELGEWTKHDNINANAFARIKESTSVIKTYFGNQKSFVYWLDNPDNVNDVDGATGIVDSVGIVNTSTETGAQIIIDSGLTSGIYTGAVIRITSGTGEGAEAVVLTQTSTGIVVSSAFSTTPDSTSNYSIGDINAYYSTKWYDLGDSTRYKSFRKLFFWAKEASSNEVDVSYSEDFGGEVGSETKNLSPASSSLWDSALWDVGTWGTTGDKFYTTNLTGRGRVLNLRFEETSIDKDFNIYGFHILADRLDRE